MSSAGDWEVTVSEPHPVWIGISFEGRELVRFRHNHLRDLEYAVARAIVEARGKLPEHCKAEMD